MAKTGLRIEALIEALPLSEWNGPGIIQSGWGANIFLNEAYFPSRIVECERPLGPGDKGVAIIDIINSDDDAFNLSPGACFQLRDGPLIVVANAKVLRIIK